MSFFGGASNWEHVNLAKSDAALSEVWCRNPNKYVFHLEKTGTASQYRATRIAAKDLSFSKPMDETVYRHIRATYAVNGVPVSKLLNHSGFSIKTVEMVQEGVMRLVHVKYGYEPVDDDMIRDGELWLAPDYGWAISRSRSDYLVPDRPDAEAGMTCDVDFAGMDEGVAIPIVVKTVQRLGAFRIEEELADLKVARGTSNLNNFTLSHYGLSETNPTYASRPTRQPLFLVINAIVIVVIGLAVWWRRQRRSS